MRAIVRAGAWTGFRQTVEDLGGDANVILAAAHIDPAWLLQPDRYLPHKALIDTLDIAARRLDCPDFGMRWGAHQDVSMFGPLSVAILNASTGREAIEIAGRYMHLHSPASVVTITPRPRSDADFIGLALKGERIARSVQHAERGVSTLHHVMPALCGPDYGPREVCFTHKRLSPLSVYRAVFGVTPRFEQPMSGIAVDRALLDTPQPGRSAQLRKIADAFLDSLGPARDPSFSSSVANMIRGLQRSGDYSSLEVAKALGVHERTLQRRLKAEGSSFEAIKDDIRREYAESLLAQQGITLSQIAFMTGYSDLSAFSRSARRWFGAPPRVYRERLLARPQAAAPPRPFGSQASARSARK